MQQVRVVERDALSAEDLAELLAWLESAYDEGPWRPEHWREVGPGPHAILYDDHGGLLAHACVDWIDVAIGDRPVAAGYLEDVATRPDARGRGFGTAVVRAAQAEIARRADIGFLATGSTTFYERLGWFRWRGPTSVVEADGSITRTEEEDGAIMALRLPSTPTWATPHLPIRRPRRDPDEAW